MPAIGSTGSLAKGAPVLVIYMALKHIEQIAQRLIAAGRQPGEPVAIVAKEKVSMSILAQPRFALPLIALAWSMGAAQAAELLMFEAPGCPYCKAWHAQVGVGYPKSGEGQRAPLRVLPLAKANDVGVMLGAPINASPTFVLVDNGKEIGRIVGYPGADFFWAMLGQLVSKLDHKSQSTLDLGVGKAFALVRRSSVNFERNAT